MKIVLASIVTAARFAEMHLELGVKDVLLSFAELKFSSPEFLPTFVKTGLHPPKHQGRRYRDETWDSPVSREVKVKVGKEKPPPKKKVKASRRHWQKSVYRKYKRIAVLQKIKAYENEFTD